MRVLALCTYTDCENKWRSLQSVGHAVTVMQYDDRPHERHGELVDAAKAIAPDFILFIGAVEQYHGRPVPSTDILCALNAVAPMIHMCDDAGDPPWWPMLEIYNNAKCFTVQVSIDGASGTPIDRFENGMVLLTPIDWRVFHPQPWKDKTINCGMVGGIGHNDRKATIEHLQSKGLIDFYQGPIGRTYEEMAEIMGQTKVTFNFGVTGSTQSMHVKGRVVEAGFSFNALLEKSGSPTKNWFKAGEEFFEFDDVSDAIRILEKTSDHVWQEMALKFRNRVIEEHHPTVFWDKVLARAFQRELV